TKLATAIAQENAKESTTLEHKVNHEYNIHGQFRGFAGQFSPTFVARVLSRDSSISLIEPDGKVTAFGTQGGNVPWGLRRISQRTRATQEPYYYPDSAGSGVTAYVLDTGIATEHREFQGRARWGRTFCAGCPDRDDHGHGTHCAGTIASATYGVAKRASVVAVKVLDSNGKGDWSNVIAGINWVVEQVQKSGNKRALMSMSLGGGGNQTLADQAVEAAIAAGVHVIAAAGNDGASACNVSPARVRDTITVGATDPSDRLASFSNWGRCVSLLAPGVNIRSTLPGGRNEEQSGTSMAAPHAAGVAALLLADSPNGLMPAELKRRMLSLATKDVVSNTKGSPNLLLFNG
ncbi:peptidase S8/S53 domain-containing protein, partial [Catenaria anguillulae PL171]